MSTTTANFMKVGIIVKNKDVRVAIESANLKYWQIAQELGCTDGNFSRKLRKELPPEEKRKIFDIIERLSKVGK